MGVQGRGALLAGQLHPLNCAAESAHRL